MSLKITQILPPCQPRAMPVPDPVPCFSVPVLEFLALFTTLVQALKFGVQNKILDLQQRDRAKKRSETHLNTVYAKNVENFVDNKVSADKFDDIMGLTGTTGGQDEKSEDSVRELQQLDGLSGIARKSDSGSYMFNKMEVNKEKLGKSQNIDRVEILKSIKMKLGK